MGTGGNSFIGSGLVGWTLLVIGGFVVLGHYANQAGPEAKAPPTWPESAGIQRDEARPTLLFFAHPRCPCTMASLDELERIMARCPGLMRTEVVILHPLSFDSAWTRTDLRRRVESIPDVLILEDSNGMASRRFGVETSGQVLLYSQDGGLIFRGGITAGRGHEGDNDGSDAVVALIRNEQAKGTEYPVYGCRLFDSPSSSPGATCRR